MPTKQQFKDWKSQGPMKVGVFEKMNWQKGPEEPTDTVRSSLMNFSHGNLIIEPNNIRCCWWIAVAAVTGAWMTW